MRRYVSRSMAPAEPLPVIIPPLNSSRNASTTRVVGFAAIEIRVRANLAQTMAHQVARDDLSASGEGAIRLSHRFTASRPL